jgi:hypothetical protein
MKDAKVDQPPDPTGPSKESKTIDGPSNASTFCFKAWYNANREEFLARRRARYNSDPEVRERQRKAAKRWKLEHPQKSAGSMRKINGTVTPVLRISAVAKILDRTVLTLRQWEQKGWVPAASQSQGRHRTYTPHQVKLLVKLAAFLDEHSYAVRNSSKLKHQFSDLVQQIKERWDEPVPASAPADTKPSSA